MCCIFIVLLTIVPSRLLNCYRPFYHGVNFIFTQLLEVPKLIDRISRHEKEVAAVLALELHSKLILLKQINEAFCSVINAE